MADRRHQRDRRESRDRRKRGRRRNSDARVFVIELTESELRIAQLERELYDTALERVSRVVEPAVLLVMAGAVSAAALAVYQPVLGSASLLLGGSQ